MKKRTIVAISVLVAVVLVVLAGFGIYMKTSAPKNENLELFSCLPSEITGYGVKKGDMSYQLVKKDDVWSVEGNDVAVLEQSAVKNLVNSASMISSQGVLKERHLKEFEIIGVETLTLTLADGSDHKFEFVGIKGETCALRLDGGEELYLVRKSLRDIVFADLDKLRAALVFEELAKSDDVLTYYSFTDYDGTKTVVRTKNSAEISKNKDNRYIMVQPYQKDVDDERFEQQIVVRIPNIAATSYVDENPENLQDYGLDEQSRATLHFRWGDVTETLYIGENEAGKIHAIREGRDGVFQINSSVLEFLHTEPFFMLESGILKSDIENINGLTVKIKDESYEISSSGKNSSSPQFYVNGKAASQLAFDSALEKLGDIEILSELQAVPENTQEIVVNVYFNNQAGIETISLVTLNSKEYAAFINGTAEFAVDKKTVDALIEELRALAKNPLRTN